MKNFKPMLAGTHTNPKNVRFPVIMSPKLDGIRIVIHPELGPVTRSLKPVPNLHIRAMLNRPEFHYLDGEIIVGAESESDTFNTTTSAVMSSRGEPNFTLVVFDSFENPADPYSMRMAQAKAQIAASGSPLVRFVDSPVASNMGDMLNYEMDNLEAGYEGIMYRNPNGPYKFGRSTERENTLVKVKQFTDSEAKVVGVEWLKHNMNEATTNALGRTERSSHASGKMEDSDQIGALVVEGVGEFEGVQFKIGTGFTEAKRHELARDRALVGRVVNYRYQAEGAKDAPRFPVFHGFRSVEDMGE
ncbi:MAG: hypothetical protein ACRC5T_03525 [Cetobacterium sp.]